MKTVVCFTSTQQGNWGQKKIMNMQKLFLSICRSILKFQVEGNKSGFKKILLCKPLDILAFNNQRVGIHLSSFSNIKVKKLLKQLLRYKMNFVSLVSGHDWQLTLSWWASISLACRAGVLFLTKAQKYINRSCHLESSCKTDRGWRKQENFFLPSPLPFLYFEPSTSPSKSFFDLPKEED